MLHISSWWLADLNVLADVLHAYSTSATAY